MTTWDTDADLVQACVAGERPAWNELVARYTNLVYASILRAARGRGTHLSDDEVADLHQGIFLALYEDDCRRLRAFGGRCKLSSWIKVVSVNLTIDQLRRRQRARKTFAPVPMTDDGVFIEPPSPGGDVERHVMAIRDVDSLRQAVEALAEPDRILLDRLFAEEVPYEDIAAELGVSVGAIYTRKTRLLNRLRDVVAGELVQPREKAGRQASG